MASRSAIVTGAASGIGRSITERLLAHHPGDQSVYIQVTRGVPPTRDHVLPTGITPTVFMMCYALRSPSKDAIDNGVACITARDFRWEKCNIKSTSLLGNVLARQLSADVGATETIMLRDGMLTEASASNVFVVKGGVVAAPPRDNLILMGITYDLLVQLANEGAVRLESRPVPEVELRSADEVWLSSSTKEVLAVTTLDGKPVGSGKPGALFKRMHALFQEHKAHVRARGTIAA
jgi:D-alanine transaminase